MRRILIILTGALALLTSCVKNAGQDIYCEVTVEAVLPSGQDIVALKIDNAQPGNYFRDLNTGQEYDIPIFVYGKCRVKVLKGVYLVSFDGLSALADGSACRVRSAEYSTSLNAVNLVGDRAELLIHLIVLQ